MLFSMSVKDRYCRDEKGNLYRDGVMVSKNKSRLRSSISYKLVKIKRWFKI